MIQITNNPASINRENYKNLCLMSTVTDPHALSNNPEKYKVYTQENREKKIKQYI